MENSNQDELKFLLVTRQFLKLKEAGYSISDLRKAGYSLSYLLKAGYSASDLLNAGYSISDLLNAGYLASDLRKAGYLASARPAPKLNKPYTKLIADIEHNLRQFNQSTFGPPVPVENLCKTPMCIAGHLVNMAGDEGWKLKDELGYAVAAALIHDAAHPDIPCPRFDNYSDELAMGFIRHMAKLESTSR